MASTYSTSLRLELMATGDQSGTWGDTTNTNLGTLLEQAITGVLSVAQGDVANLTLTSLNGASDQARNAVVNLTGAMTANRNVVVPTANKVYLIKNSTTGGFVVTVKTAAGTGVTIPNGTARWVYCDGTNVVDAMSGPWSPSSNDAQALGAAGNAWADLFLASGAVINWNAGNVTLTHSAGNLDLSSAAAGSLLTLTSTDAGATSGPNLELYRNSASPAASDILGTLYWYGKDSAGNKQEYASLETVVTDHTSTSEDSALNAYVFVGGTRRNSFSVTGQGIALADTDYSHQLAVVAGSNLTAARTLTITTGDADHTLNISDAPTSVVLASGTYTPTLTNTTNIAASTAAVTQYLQVGNVVTVAGTVQIDPTTSGLATELQMSLPVASSIGISTDLGGAGVSSTANAWRINGHAATDTASFVTVVDTNANHIVSFTFSYRVI